MTELNMTYHDLLADALAFESASHSPCVGICDHNEKNGCSGCHRPHDEVEKWRDTEPEIRLNRWLNLPASLANSGINTMRLPLSQDSILQLAKARLNEGGAWMIGGKDYHVTADHPCEELAATNEDQSITIRLASEIKMRAVLWAPHGRRLDDDISSLPIALVTPRIRIERSEGWHQRPQDDRYPETLYQSDKIRFSTNEPHSHRNMLIESVIAEAKIYGASHLPTGLTEYADIPEGLNLPASYVLGLTILPPDMVT